MRIISGQFGGRQIIAPKGAIARPTSDKARGALFNILTARGLVDFEGANVIDLFAGSGALGLEALSRGAAFCLFVETNASARGAIRDNVEALGLMGATRVHRRSAIDLGKRPASRATPFNVAFLDPPYDKELASKALASLTEGGWLCDDAIIVIEQGERETPVANARFEELDRRQYGAAQIGIYRFHPVTDH